MPRKPLLPAHIINWILEEGRLQYTVAELVNVTGNVVTYDGMNAILYRKGLKAITMQQRAEKEIIDLSNAGKLISINDACRITGYCPQLISKIVHKNKLPVVSKVSKRVMRNRWKRKSYRKPYKKREHRVLEFELKKQAVAQMLNKQRAKW